MNVTWLQLLMTAILAYYLTIFVAAQQPPRRPCPRADDPLPTVLVVIPARNEAVVLERTVREALAQPYAGTVRVFVIDDASTDETPTIADTCAARWDAVRVLHRSAEVGGRGKGAALNHAFDVARRSLEAGDPWWGGARAEEVVFCILDADGRLSPSAMTDVASYFTDPSVGAVQIGVQIRNARQSFLARMQDIEFVGFAYMIQVARDRWGSVGLGGNGQFTRLSALATLGAAPWSPGALTEDLDLGLRMIAAGWRLRYCPTAWVDQQGLTNLKALLRQRTRWIQGHYSCWKHIPAIARTNRMRRLGRVDVIIYLTLVIAIFLMAVSTVISVLSFTGAITLAPSPLMLGRFGTAGRALSFTMTTLPVGLVAFTYQRFAVNRLAWYEIPLHCLLLAVYPYHGLIATVRALTRLGLRRNNWVKTPRLKSAEVAATA